MRNKAFTLIELLIVVALALILLVMALPSSRKAKHFAKFSQTRANMLAMDAALHAHLADWGSVPADYSDPSPLLLAYRMRSATSPICEQAPDRDFATDGGLNFVVPRDTFYSEGNFCPLTTPISYISAEKTLDPFSDGTVPFGYNSRSMGSSSIAYGGFFSAGPDLIAGDWVRGGPGLIPFSVTNGTASRGEFWGLVSDCEFGADPTNPCVAETDGFPSRTVFPPPHSDLNLDNQMNAKDLFVFLSDWGKISDSSRK